MRSLCLLMILIGSTNSLRAQADCVCTNCPVPLPDVLSTTFNGYIQVSGANNNVLGGNNCLESICLNITHSWIGDLDISLTSPDGTTIMLFADGNPLDGCPCGNQGNDFEVCFTLPGQSTNGSFAGTDPANCTNTGYFMPCNGTTPCYTGTWEPWDQLCGIGGLDVFNNGTGTVNGIWTITINDNAGLNQGTLQELEINFCDDDGITCLSVDPGCLADAGTVTTVFSGSSTTSTIICDGGSVDIQSNGDYTLPDPGCLGCTPDLIYAIYTNGGPSTSDPDTDPNFSTYYWTGPDFTTGNSGGFNTNTGGVQSLISQLIPSADNSWCFVPITADANDIFDLDHDLDGDGCFALGTPVCFQFLNPISAATQSSCSGSLSIELTGGYPEFNGGNFTVTNTGSGTLSPTSVAHGGTFNISGLTNGQTYSYTVSSHGCSQTFSGTFTNTLTVTLTPATATVTSGNCVALTGAVTATGGNVSFSNFADYNIPDNGVGGGNNNPLVNTGPWVISPINVSGVCPATYTTGRYMSVCMNIYHDWEPDVNIWLQSPDGTFIRLSNNNGDGVDFDQTCFTTTATTNITAGTWPLSGNYIPEQPFSLFNGLAINGTWNLWIGDDTFFDEGYLMDWTITFDNTPATSYTWSPPTGLSATNTLTPNACPTTTTTYTLTGNTDCGCTATATAVITVSASAPTAVISSSTNVLCNGFSTGAATVTASAGLPPYTYSWNTSPAQSGATATGLPAGTYTVTVTDANLVSATATVTITEPPELQIYVHGVDPSCATICDGTATVDVAGGTSPYTYLWSTGAVTQSISALCAGTYSVAVTDGNGCSSTSFNPVNGCFQIQGVLVNSCSSTEWNEEMVFFQVGSTPLNTSSFTVTWPTLANSWRGLCTNPTYIAAVNATITGGGIVLPMPVSGILPANANVVLITENVLNAPIADYSNLSGPLYMIFQCSGNTLGHFTNNGATASNPLVLNFGGGCTQSVTYVGNSLPNYSGSGDGGYVLYASDGTSTYLNYGCSIPYTIQSDEVILVEPPTVPITVSPSSTTICSSGSTTLTASGATSYTWSPSSGLSGTTGSSVTANPSSTTTYTVTGTLNGCTGSASSVITVITAPNAGTNSTLSICSNDAAVNLFSALGGTPNSGGTWTGTSTLTGSDLGTFTPGVNAAGTYTYTVNGSAPCSNATATVTVSVTTAPLAYFTYLGAPYCRSIVVPQSPIITGTTGGTFTSSPAGLSIVAGTGVIMPSSSLSGTYTITYTIPASNPCAEYSVTQTVVINETPLTPSLVPSPPCAGQSSTFTAENGIWYEFTLNGTQVQAPSDLNTYTSGILNTNDKICVYSYPLPPFHFEGNITEAEWGNPLATSAGGPTTSGFGAGNNLDAIYLHNSSGYLFGAVASNVVNNSNNRVLVFIDCQSGGYNSLASWTVRTNAPYYSVENLSSNITFDVGFTPEYILAMNQAGGDAFFDLYNMVTNTNIYLGSDLSSTLLGFIGNTGVGDYLKGFEFAIPMISLGNPAGTIRFFTMMVNDPGAVPPTFVSNQFLTHAGSAESNYADGTINFASATPNPLSYALSEDCKTQTCVTAGNPITPTFTSVAPICSGGSLTALPTTSNNGITGTWAPALNNTTTTVYTFTPDASFCANTTTLTITVNPNVTPTFTAVAPICSGGSLSALPTTSNNSITGTWAPALDNTTTTTYTFTPTAGQCATTTTLTITVNPNVTPTFTAVTPICSGGSLSALPTTSNNSIIGTWAPALDNTTTTTYTFTPTAGQCATTTTLTITVNSNVTPTFMAVTPICSGASLSALPTTSNNGITGTWAPALDNTTTTTYTFTPDAGQCATTTTLTITVNSNVTPTFTAVTPICSGGSLSALPTTSNNSITGTWAPALDNTTTTTYTFTPTAGQCATTTTLTITVNPNTTPTFTAVAPICSGASLSALPTTSNNSITGTWAPALDNTTTTTYTFTPDAGQCATTTTLTITVNPNVTPTFTAVAPICSGGSLSALPTTSNNSIIGTWTPALDNTTTTTYTFTPDAGQCATTATLSITVNPNTTPTFTAVVPICSGGSLSALPTTSNNSITGTWAPALDNTTTTTYTFTPDAGQCATTTTLTITVNPNVTPTFTAVAPICSGGSLSALPTTSNNSITGTWAPALDNTTTTTYTFTPDAGQCATTTTLTITVNPNVTPTFNPIGPFCQNAIPTSLPSTSTNGITGTWLPAVISTSTVGTSSYVFTPDAGQCATSTSVSVTIATQISPTFIIPSSFCLNEVPPSLPGTSNNGITGTWSPSNISTSTGGTVTYTFTPDAGQCADVFTIDITVNNLTLPTFSSIPPFCSGSTAPTLPSTSNNGITGTWSPTTINNTTSGTYTFTPDAGQCASSTTLTTTVNPLPVTTPIYHD